MAGLAAAIGQRTNGASVTLVERALRIRRGQGRPATGSQRHRLLKRWGLLEKVAGVA